MNRSSTIMALSVVALFLLSANTSQSQVDTAWVRHFDGAASAWDEPTDMATDSMGNVYVIGSTGEISPDIASFLIIKYNPEGTVLWQRTYTANPNYHATARALVVTSDGFCYVAGDSPYDGGIVVLGFSPNGELLWSRAGLGTVPWDIALDNSGNVIVGGKQHVSGGNNDFIALKYDPAGNLLWSRTWDRSGGWDEPARITIDLNDDIYLAGFTKEPNDNDNAVLVKFDTAGNLLWWRMWDGPDQMDEGARDIASDADGNVYVGLTSVGPTSEDWVVLKYRATGELLWERWLDFAGEGNDVLLSLSLHPSGGIVATGYSYLLPTWDPVKFDVIVARVSSDGDSLWALKYNGPWGLEDAGFDVETDTAGNAFVVGYVSDSTDKNCLLLKFDSAGALTWTWDFPKPENGKATSGSLVRVGGDGRVYIAGTDNWTLTGADVIVIRLLECAGPLAEPYAPTVSAAPLCPSIGYTVEWAGVPDAAVYQLYENDSLVYEGTDTSAQAVHAQGEYEYYVVAKSAACGMSDAGQSTTVSILGYPSEPSRPIVSDNTPCPGMSFSINWSSAQNASSYRLLEDGVPIYEGPLTSSSASHAAGNHSYRVIAVNPCGESSPSSFSDLVQIPDCPCHADPQCDGVTNVLDVILTIEVAFRGGPSIVDSDPLCNPERTDANCDLSTGVVDVVKVIDVAFRGISQGASFCPACIP